MLSGAVALRGSATRSRQRSARRGWGTLPYSMTRRRTSFASPATGSSRSLASTLTGGSSGGGGGYTSNPATEEYARRGPSSCPYSRTSWKRCSPKFARSSRKASSGDGHLHPAAHPSLVVQVPLPEGALQVTLLAPDLVALDR